MEIIDLRAHFESRYICVFYLRAKKLISNGVKLENLPDKEKNCLNCPNQGYCGLNNLEDQFMFRNPNDTVVLDYNTFSGDFT